MPLRRLTLEEHASAVQAVLGAGSDVVEGLFPDERVGPFRLNVSPVSNLHVEQLAVAAEDLALRAIQDLDRLVACDTAALGERDCGTRFIADVGARAYRRPLTEVEQERYRSIFEATLTEHGFAAAVRVVLQGMLQSLHFLYHVPSTAAPATDGPARLTPHALASRMAFALTRRPPDALLTAAAADGELEHPAGVERHARRLLETEAGHHTFSHFHLQLLGVDEALEAGRITEPSIATETADFVDHVMADDGTLTSLLTAPFTVGDSRTAARYGAAPPDGRGVIALDPTQRAGLLTQAAFLTVHDKTVTRGLAMNELLLCSVIPPPPPGVDQELPAPEPGASPRERWAAHVEDPACAGCHERLDPIGFGFAHYDAEGVWRDTEEGFPVDATGHVAALDGDPAFDGAVELATILAEREQVHRCIVRQWMQYLLGRTLVAADRCFEDVLYERLRDSGMDVRELLVALVTSEAFMSIAEVPGE
jgi:hypothetical protein